jgi:hypothetical protein
MSELEARHYLEVMPGRALPPRLQAAALRFIGRAPRIR